MAGTIRLFKSSDGKLEADDCDYVCAEPGVEKRGVGVTVVSDPQVLRIELG